MKMKEIAADNQWMVEITEKVITDIVFMLEASGEYEVERPHACEHAFDVERKVPTFGIKRNCRICVDPSDPKEVLFNVWQGNHERTVFKWPADVARAKAKNFFGVEHPADMKTKLDQQTKHVVSTAGEPFKFQQYIDQGRFFLQEYPREEKRSWKNECCVCSTHVKSKDWWYCDAFSKAMCPDCLRNLNEGLKARFASEVRQLEAKLTHTERLYGIEIERSLRYERILKEGKPKTGLMDVPSVGKKEATIGYQEQYGEEFE